MDMKQAAQIMRTYGWFSRQPRDFQSELIGQSALRYFEKGETLYHVGDPPAGVFGLVEGIVKIEFAVPGASYRVASMKEPGFWTGEAAAFRLGNRLVTIRIDAPTYMLHLPLAKFEKMIANPIYCRCFAILTVEHLEEAFTVLANMLGGTTESRVAARLVSLSQCNGFVKSADLPIAQSDLAEMCALSRQTVHQVLSNLEGRGLIEVKYRRIVITDLDSLAEAAAIHRS